MFFLLQLMSKETPVTGGNDSYADLDRQVRRSSCRLSRPVLVSLVGTNASVCVSQLKKTAEELNDALAAKEEISQRCRELDMQVSPTLCLVPITPYSEFFFGNFFLTFSSAWLKPAALF